MYQIGQCIVYRNVGVCRVEAIGKLGFNNRMLAERAFYCFAGGKFPS